MTNYVPLSNDRILQSNTLLEVNLSTFCVEMSVLRYSIYGSVLKRPADISDYPIIYEVFMH